MARPLICPTCQEPLLFVGKAYNCRRCPASYAVRDGIPILLPAEPGALVCQESDYWNRRFDLEANVPHLIELYGNADFIEDEWRLLG
jgi:uncharacterized protein YbaR (Trm112 family)